MRRLSCMLFYFVHKNEFVFDVVREYRDIDLEKSILDLDSDRIGFWNL